MSENFEDLDLSFLSDPLALASVCVVPDLPGEHPFQPNLPQQDFLTSNKKWNYFVAHRRCGKALHEDEIVLTPTGWQAIKDLQVGDIVVTPDGNLSNVTETIDNGLRPTYKVWINDSYFIEADEEHLWPVFQQNGYDYGHNIVLSTREILDRITTNPYTTFHLYGIDKDRLKKIGYNQKDISKNKTITEIEFYREARTVCINIDHFERLYLCKNFTPTHNCVDGSTKIIDPKTLRPRRIDEMQDSDSTWSYDFKANKLVNVKSTWINSGKKNCLKIKTLTGTNLIVSTDHLLYSKTQGWVKAETLNIGDHILGPSLIPIYGNVVHSNQLIQNIIDENYLHHELSPSIFQYDKNTLIEFFKELFLGYGRLFNEQTLITIHSKNIQMSEDYHHLLLRLGVCSEVHSEKVIIRDSVDVNLFLNYLGYDIECTDVRSPRRWHTITELYEVGIRPVYDLSVDHDDHNFLANDFIIHNSLVQTFRALFLAITEERKQIIVFTPSDDQRQIWFNTLDKWLERNKILDFFLDRSGRQRSSSGSYVRTFLTGTTITGYITGMVQTAGGKRGITGDYFFVDEAQELSDGDWQVIRPMMSGDSYRSKYIKNFITGTTNKPGDFYNVVKNREKDANNPKFKNRAVIFWPITRRLEMGEITQDLFEEFRNETPTDKEWNEEWLLQLGGGELSVFSRIEIDNTFALPYEYVNVLETELSNNPKFIGVDWDMVQSGVNIVVVEYDPENRWMKTIHREIFDSTEYHYAKAVDRILELIRIVNPKMVVCDQGAGLGQIHQLQYQLSKMGGNPDIIVPCAFNTNINSMGMVDGELKTITQKAKPFLISYLKKKMQEKLMFISPYDDEAQEQFLAYKVEEITNTNIKYSNKNEHIIDAHMFAAYGIYKTFECDLQFYSGANILVYDKQSNQTLDIQPDRDEFNEFLFSPVDNQTITPFTSMDLYNYDLGRSTF